MTNDPYKRPGDPWLPGPDWPGWWIIAGAIVFGLGILFVTVTLANNIPVVDPATTSTTLGGRP